MNYQQYLKKKQQAPSGWRYGLSVYNDDKLTQSETIDPTHYVTYTLEYVDEYERYTNVYGCKCTRVTGRKVLNINIALWYKPTADALASSSGLGRWVAVGEPQERKTYAYMCKIAQTLSAEDLHALYLQDTKTLENACILG